MIDTEYLEQSESVLKPDLSDEDKLMFEEYQELIYSLGYMPRPE